MQGFDAEQIWAQIEMLNNAAVAVLRPSIHRLEVNNVLFFFFFFF